MGRSILSVVSLADELEQFFQETIPKADTVQKYGGTLFTLAPKEKEGQFCGIFVQKEHVHISFSKGSELKDPKGILLGTGKYRRHLNFKSSEEVDFKELKKLLKQAVKL